MKQNHISDRPKGFLSVKDSRAIYKKQVGEHEAWLRSKGFMTRAQYLVAARALLVEAAAKQGVTFKMKVEAEIRVRQDRDAGKFSYKARCEASVVLGTAFSGSPLFGKVHWGLPGGVRWEVALLALKARIARGAFDGKLWNRKTEEVK